MGITSTSGMAYDFAGPYTVNEGELLFGSPTRILQLHVLQAAADTEPVLAASSENVYDDVLRQTIQTYEGRMYHLCMCNCHHMVVHMLNRLHYQGKDNWEVVGLSVWGSLATWLLHAGILMLLAGWFKLQSFLEQDGSVFVRCQSTFVVLMPFASMHAFDAWVTTPACPQTPLETDSKDSFDRLWGWDNAAKHSCAFKLDNQQPIVLDADNQRQTWEDASACIEAPTGDNSAPDMTWKLWGVYYGRSGVDAGVKASEQAAVISSSSTFQASEEQSNADKPGLAHFVTTAGTNGSSSDDRGAKTSTQQILANLLSAVTTANQGQQPPPINTPLIRPERLHASAVATSISLGGIATSDSTSSGNANVETTAVALHGANATAVKSASEGTTHTTVIADGQTTFTYSSDKPRNAAQPNSSPSPSKAANTSVNAAPAASRPTSICSWLPTPTNSTKDANGRRWGWDASTNSSCIYNTSALTEDPLCPASADNFTSVTDSHGHSWGWDKESNTSCVFK
eukprot:gene5726-5966_t